MQLQIEEQDSKWPFQEQGFLGPIRILNTQECAALRSQLLAAPAPLDWDKGHGATSTAFFELATHPAIVERVVELIGEDVMLWGASLQRRRPGGIHPWHTDIETRANRDGTVSVWIGLENTRMESSLTLAVGSHRPGVSVQETAYLNGKHRSEVTSSDIEHWSRQLGGTGSIVQPSVTDGEALIMDGRLWHASHNQSPDGTRTAVLLQYARPDIPIRIPDLEQLEFPFRNLDDTWPPCVMVHGSARSAVNRIVPAPLAENGQSSRVRSIDSTQVQEDESAWSFYSLFDGSTRCVSEMNCHFSVLSPGASPHQPHSHEEEEILVVLDGSAEVELVEPDGLHRRHSVDKGCFAFYPVGQAHTIHNTSSHPITYLMFKWKGSAVRGSVSQLQAGVFHERELIRELASTGESGFHSAEAFKGPTCYLLRLESHLSRLEPGAGYATHIDAYDVGMVLIEGSLETLGQRVESPALIFYAAGEPHGIRNPATNPASYIVFEFHGAAVHRASTSLTHWMLGRTPSGVLNLLPPRLKRAARRFLLGY